MGALTPLVKVAGRWRTWIAAVTLHTLTGLVVSTAIGAGLGEMGHVLGLGDWPHVIPVAAGGAALVLAAREVGVVRFPLPQRPLQTEKVWMHEFGPVGAATLWGVHLSLGFFTWINYGGFWVVTLLALGLGDPRYGIVLTGGHWLGKTLSLWVAPVVLRDSSDSDELLAVWGSRTALYRRVQAVGLVAIAVVLGAWLLAPAGGI
jgi:hypothetical protein